MTNPNFGRSVAKLPGITQDNGPPTPRVHPLVDEADRKFIDGEISAYAHLLSAYKRARESAEVEVVSGPTATTKHGPHYLPPLDEEARDFLAGRMNASDYLGRTYSREEGRAKQELGSTSDSPALVLAEILILVVVAIAGMTLVLTLNLSEGVSGPLVLIGALVAVATGLFNAGPALHKRCALRQERIDHSNQ